MNENNMNEVKTEQKSFDEYLEKCFEETENRYGWIRKLDNEKFNQLWETHNKLFSALLNN